MLGRLLAAWRRGASPWVGLRDGPRVDDLGRTEVPGLRVAGDLADTPLLKTALRQGWDIGCDLADELGDLEAGHGDDDVLDVVIVGAGPAGCTAAMALAERGRSYVVLERHAPFRTIDAFPAGKIIYAEPEAIETPGGLWFEDAPKEELVRRWRQHVADAGLNVAQDVEVTTVTREGDVLVVHTVHHGVRHDEGARPPATLRARRVVVAIGRRGTPRRLGVPGEDDPRVHHQLGDAADHAGASVLVVGGGDSATEAALALVDAGAQVTLVHRGERLDRPRPRTREAIEAAAADGRLTLRLGARVDAIEGDAVVVTGTDGTLRTAADAVWVLVGTEPPVAWLEGLGLTMRSRRPPSQWPWLAAFVAFTWCFYVLKYHEPWFPFGPHSLGWVHDALKVPAPWLPTVDGSVRVLDAGFFGTVLYSLAILGFGIAAIRRYDAPTQTRRYLSLIAFQWVFLFGVPELLAPMVTTASSQLYTLSVPWPLSIASIAKSPDVPAAALWIAIGAFVSFVAMPLFVWRHNERFCSWMCGCGGLAETVGDLWRWRAPRGDLAERAEWGGRIVFLLAVPVTLLILADAWKLVGWQSWIDATLQVDGDHVTLVQGDVPEAEGHMRVHDVAVRDGVVSFAIDKFDWDHAWHDNGWTSGLQAGGRTVYPDKVAEGHYTVPLASLPQGAVVVQAGTSSLSSARQFAQGWYALMVDFALASFLGVALYPMLGNRVWCRFFCPLRAYMEWLSKGFGRLAIVADDRCISCGACTTECQMGIDVQGFAEKQLVLDNVASACIQCGICVEVCPMDVLTLVDKRAAGVPDGARGQPGPRWGA
ncbi:MAG: NAD(P)-binding domain-containing protein [Alphaproteobacteria bacterium]|nr:NAD(P)-binding domain-containing protein [Alphaproteobacteria bacterium]